ncbi:MAG: DUF2079 domain-containing protein [Anaerolineae bacterium]
MKIWGFLRKLGWGQGLCLMGIALYTATFFILQVRLYRGLHMGITDLGYFDQSMYNSLHGRFLQVSFDIPSPFRLKQSSNSPHMFAQHPFIIMLFVLPIYALFPHTYTLFFIQAFAAAIGALAVFLMARYKWGSEWAALCFSLSFLLYPTLQGININLFTYGFHPENLFPPLFLFAFYFYQVRKPLLFTIFFLLAVFVVESYTLLCAAFGLYILLTNRAWRKVGLLAFCLSLLWFIVSVQVIVPHFKVDKGYAWWVEGMRGGRVFLEKYPQILSFLRPFGRYLLRLLMPVLFLPLAAPGLFALAVPNLLVNFSALFVGYEAPVNYNAWQSNPIVPPVFISAIYGLDNLLPWIKDETKRRKILWGGAAVVLATSVVANYWLGPLPFSRAASPQNYAVDEARAASVDEIRTLIPQEASLSADYYLGSQFTRREILHWFPDRWRKVDYILIDLTSEWTQVYEDQLKYLHDSPYHELIYDANGIHLFQRLYHPPQPMQQSREANFGNAIKLLGYTASAENARPGDTLQLILYWQALDTVERPYTVFVHLLDEEGRIRAQEDSMPMSNLYPTDEWEAGEIVVDKYYDLKVDPATPPGEYVVEVGLYYWVTGERLPVLDIAGNPQDTRIILTKVRVEDG